MQNLRHCPDLDSSTESTHLDDIPQGRLQVHYSGAPIAAPRQPFRELEGEAGRVQANIVWRRGCPSQRHAVFFTLLGGGPAYLCQRGCVYTV
jgi:hypothetical protein